MLAVLWEWTTSNPAATAVYSITMPFRNTSQKMAKGNACRNILPEPSKHSTQKHPGPPLVPPVAFFALCWVSIIHAGPAFPSTLYSHSARSNSTVYTFGRRGAQPVELQINQPHVISAPFFWRFSALWVKLRGLILKAGACGRKNHVQSRNGSKQWDASHGAKVLASNLLGSQKLKSALVQQPWRLFIRLEWLCFGKKTPQNKQTIFILKLRVSEQLCPPNSVLGVLQEQSSVVL